ncbi:MAG: hypothetical protein ACI8Q9_000491 [Planctomycetota bacterium]|jgi:hypothetical protein
MSVIVPVLPLNLSRMPPMSSPDQPSAVPSPEELKAQLMGLGADERKVIAGMVVLMMKEPGKIRDREWLLEAYTHISAQALEMGDERLEQLKELVQERRDLVLNTSFALFFRVAQDAAELGGTPTLAQASVMAMAYFSDGPAPSFEPVDD